MATVLTGAEANLLPTVYFKKLILENAAFQGVQTRHLQPIVPPGGTPHPLYDIQSDDEDSTGPGTEIPDTTSDLRVSLQMEVKFEFDNNTAALQFISGNDTIPSMLSYVRILLKRTLDDKEDTDINDQPTGGWPLSDFIGHSIDFSNFPAVPTPNGTIMITIPIGGSGIGSVYKGPDISDVVDTPELPVNLSYSAYCWLDTADLEALYGIDLAGVEVQGLTTTEDVLVNSELKKTSTIYVIAPVTQAEDPSLRAPRPEDQGQLWPGAVRYMMTSREVNGIARVVYYWVPDLPYSSSSPYYNVKLEQRTIANTKLIDYRLMDEILNIDLDFTPATNIIDDLLDSFPCLTDAKVGTKLNTWFNNASPYSADVPQADIGTSCLKNRRIKLDTPDMYLSDVFISRDARSNCRFLFNLDYKRILRDKSAFGSLYEGDANASQIEKFSPILNLKIVRRRVDPEPSYNRLGTPIEGRVTSDFNSNANPVEFIIESQDNPGGILKTIEVPGKGEIKETNSLQLLDGSYPFQDNGIRTFSVSDLSFAYVRNTGDIPDDYYTYGLEVPSTQIPDPVTNQPTSPAGIYYQYGIELEIEDGSIRFLNKILDNADETDPGLRQIANNLKKYYGLVEQIVNSTKYYTDDDAIGIITNIEIYDGEFAPYYISSHLSKLVAAILKGDTESDLKTKFENLLIPDKVSLESINSLLSLVRNLINSIEKGLGHYLTPSFPTFRKNNVDKPAKRAILTLNKYFYNIFDASVPHTQHLDILGQDYIKYGSLPQCSLDSFRQRVDADVSLYWKTADPLKRSNSVSLKAPYDSPQFEAITDIETSKYTFISPANVKVGFDNKRLETGLALWDLTQPQTSYGTKGMDKWSKLSSVTAALNTKDFANYGKDVGIQAGKHLLGKLGVKVIRTPVPQILITNELNLEESKYLPVADILGASDLQVNENLVGIDNGITSSSFGHCSFESTNMLEEKEFSKALPIVEAFVNNLGRNGSFARRDKSGFIGNPHAIVPSPVNKQSFDINSSTNILEKLRKSPPSPQEIKKEMPESWSAQFCTATGAVIEAGPSLGFTDDVDFWANPTTNASMTWNYGVLGKIEILTGFVQDGLPSGGGPLLKKPIFTELGPVWTRVQASLSQDGYMICRISIAENSDIGLMAQTGLDLPILNEYFMLTAGETVENLIPIVAAQSQPTTDATSITDFMARELNPGQVTKGPVVAGIPYTPLTGFSQYTYGGSSGVQAAAEGYTDYTQGFKPPGGSGN